MKIFDLSISSNSLSQQFSGVFQRFGVFVIGQTKCCGIKRNWIVFMLRQTTLITRKDRIKLFDCGSTFDIASMRFDNVIVVVDQ